MIVGAVGLPVMLMGFLVSLDLRTDLSDLRPRSTATGTPTTLIGWPDSKRENGGAGSAGSAFRVQRRGRMLGYMMDGYHPSRDGSKVGMFILMPEAGQFLHPAHLVPDQMVEVWLVKPAVFQYRSLVWVSGIPDSKTGRLQTDEAMYLMTEATVQSADQRDIIHWFEPG